MAKVQYGGLATWVSAVALGTLAAGAFAWSRLYEPLYLHFENPEQTAPVTNPGLGSTDTGEFDTDPGYEKERIAAMQYAMAVQQGQADTAVRLTLWMQDRLEHVRLTSSDEAEVQAALKELKQTLTQRLVEGNQLRPEGIEDQYVFRPGAVINPVETDEGRTTLERQVARRVWFEVEYPRERMALLDRKGHPIRSVRVGVNVSEDGHILKAGVIGNLDIEYGSISYDWR